MYIPHHVHFGGAQTPEVRFRVGGQFSPPPPSFLLFSEPILIRVNMVKKHLKHLKLSKMHCKTNLILFYFMFSRLTGGDVEIICDALQANAKPCFLCQTQ